MPARNGSNPSVTSKEIGRTGLNVSAGKVDEEYLPALKSENAISVYDQMANNDAVIGGILFAIDMLIRQVDWIVEPNSDGNDEDATFIEECMQDMSHSWTEFVSEVLTMLPYGFSFFEIVYKTRQGDQSETSKTPTSKYDDAKVGWRKFGIRSQNSLVKWEFDDTGGLQGFVQRPAPEYQELTIPIQKGLLFRTSVIKNNPEGKSILRTAYRSWYFKKRMEEVEGIGVERDLAGLPMAKVDASILQSTDTDSMALVSSIRTIIRNVRQDKEAGIIWPIIRDQDGHDLVDFTLLNSGGTRTFDITNIIERYDSRIAMSVLADFILLGHQSVGSYSLSSDKTSMFSTALGAWLQTIEEVINRFAVSRLLRVNGMDTKNPPKITHKDIEKADIATIAGYLSTLAQIGMPLFPDENLEKHLREIGDLPEMSDEAKQAHEQSQEDELGQMLGEMQQGGEATPEDQMQEQ